MKILLVVGASSDVGSALVKRIAGNYGTVWAHYRSWNENLENIKNIYGEKVRWVQADLSAPQGADKLVAEIKASEAEPDHIVYFPMPRIITQKFSKTKWEAFDAGWELSIHPAVVLMQAFLPHMQKQRSGKVLFMLSSDTIGMPPKFQSAYVTAKYALLGLMRSLATEYADKGIAINGVSPDMIQTKFISNLPHLLVEQYSETRPMKRILSIDDVVPTFEFLLSVGADHINGENICIQ